MLSHLRHNAQRQKAAISLVITAVMFSSVILIFDFLQLPYLRRAIAGDFSTIEQIRGILGFQLFFLVCYLILFSLSGIAFIQWFRRAYFNLHQLNIDLSRQDNWAAMSWFIPVMNLFVPYEMMRELYVETPKYINNTDTGITVNSKLWIINIWWALWIILGLANIANLLTSSDFTNINSLYTSTIISIVHGIIYIPLGVFAVLVIGNYGKLEAQLRASVQAEYPGVPPALPGQG